MKNRDFRLLLCGAVDSREVVFINNNYTVGVKLHTVDVIGLIKKIQEEEYFPDFTEENAWPEDIDRNNHIAIRQHLSSRPISGVTIKYKEKGIPQWETVRTPLEFIRVWKELVNNKDVMLTRVWAFRSQLQSGWVYNLDDLDNTPLDLQLNTLNNTGWNCDWIKISPATWQHKSSKHRVRF